MTVFITTPTLWFEALRIAITVRGATVENKNTTETSARHIVAFIAARRVRTKALFMVSVGATRVALRIFGTMSR
ncbi:hypothetical protein DPMN_188349 [Dreissena polymorpha]|uniref:Uncharacterized protein n=1 Tax=Dreissena polymorpha TaxID=45954 RepID=A0A9D4DRX5_DREPO|nr:hypothetical protein DPMN_188349 [Dreissena polymorpha]